MTRKLWDWVLLAGVLCFLVGATGMVFGYVGTPFQYALAVLGLILIGAGLSGKRRVA